MMESAFQFAQSGSKVCANSSFPHPHASLPASPALVLEVLCLLYLSTFSPVITWALQRQGLACFVHGHPEPWVVSNMAQVLSNSLLNEGMFQSHCTTCFPSNAFIKSATAHEQAHHHENEAPSWWRCSASLAGGGGQWPEGELSKGAHAWNVASPGQDATK